MLSFLFCAVALAVLSVVVVVMVVVVVAVMDWAAAVVVELAEGVVGVEGLWRRGSFRNVLWSSVPSLCLLAPSSTGPLALPFFYLFAFGLGFGFCWVKKSFVRGLSLLSSS